MDNFHYNSLLEITMQIKPIFDSTVTMLQFKAPDFIEATDCDWVY